MNILQKIVTILYKNINKNNKSTIEDKMQKIEEIKPSKDEIVNEYISTRIGEITESFIDKGNNKTNIKEVDKEVDKKLEEVQEEIIEESEPENSNKEEKDIKEIIENKKRDFEQIHNIVEELKVYIKSEIYELENRMVEHNISINKSLKDEIKKDIEEKIVFENEKQLELNSIKMVEVEAEVVNDVEVVEEIIEEIDTKDKEEINIDEIKKQLKVELEEEIRKNIQSEIEKKEPNEEEIKVDIEVEKQEEVKNIDNEQKGFKIFEIKEEDKVKEIKPKNIILNELEENKKILEDMEQGEIEKPTSFELPHFSFLTPAPENRLEIDETEIDNKIDLLIDKLRQFKIDGDVISTYTGPIVTTFEFKPLAHIKVSKILALQDDLAMALKAQTIRIQAPIPGKDVVGIEIPNKQREMIYLRDLLESDLFQKSKSPLTIVLGKDIVGNPFISDLKKLPHLLIAGTTGSGKSVGINAIILSLLYRNSPDDLKLIMIDPKMLEFSIYNEIPHLLTPVIIEPKKAIVALNNMLLEMTRRYELMAKTRVKNIDNYNEKFPEDKMPFIVIIIDELADLMMTSGKDVEMAIARLAQMARASGIHLIVATQRPSVDVVTGLIKANLPSRISYKVGQKIDSKVILDQFGAESLLGKGDMLFTPPGQSGLVRLHAPFTTEEEIETIVEFLKSQREVHYDENFLSESVSGNGDENFADYDELFAEAKEIVLNEQKTSISYLQRRLQIGYNRAANIIEQLETSGVLSAPNAKGQREIL